MTATVLYTGLRPPAASDGVRLVHAPTIEVRLRDPDDPDAVLAFLERHRPRVLLPSRSAVRGLAQFLESRAAMLPAVEVLAVGRASACAAREALGVRAGVPEEATAEGLARELERRGAAPALLACGESRRPVLPEALASAGAPWLEAVVYRTETVRSDAVRSALRGADWVVLTSPSTVRGFLGSLGRTDLAGLDVRLAAIGPTTEREIRTLGGEVALLADRPDPERLLGRIAAHEGARP